MDSLVKVSSHLLKRGTLLIVLLGILLMDFHLLEDFRLLADFPTLHLEAIRLRHLEAILLIRMIFMAIILLHRINLMRINSQVLLRDYLLRGMRQETNFQVSQQQVSETSTWIP
jgi:hypothetical protein